MAHLNDVILRQKAILHFERGQFPQAASTAKTYLKLRPNDVMLMRIAAIAMSRINRVEQGEALLLKCLKLDPKSAVLHADLGSILYQRGMYGEAIEAYDKALRLMPGMVDAIGGKAVVLERRNEYDDARNLLQPFVDSRTEPEGMAIVYANLLQHQGRHEDCVAYAERHLANPAIGQQARHFLCETAAKSYEKLGRIDQAFASFQKSNDLKAVPFDVADYVSTVDRLIGTFSKQNLSRLPRARNHSPLPLFIASMPRSGSTLVEQIIHAHPRAFGAGEITHLCAMLAELPKTLSSMQTYPACLGDFRQEHADALARSYLGDLAELGGKAIRVANKHLENYRQLGMVQLLFPGAKVIHVKRDALDNCFSCFMAQLTHPWATNLRNVGIAYRQYERLMAHWKDVLDIPILDVQYEELVENTDAGIRRIIDFCGLQWDDKCLRYWEAPRDVLTLSYDQVRKPIYKSAIKRYEKYEAFLGPLKEALAEPV